jgi:predicted HD phosphohydrolase
MVHSATEHVIRLFEQRGQGRYGSEQVSQLQHALQCAVLAKRQGAGSAMIAAALLHDLGHIIDQKSGSSPILVKRWLTLCACM